MRKDTRFPEDISLKELEEFCKKAREIGATDKTMVYTDGAHTTQLWLQVIEE